MACFWDSGRWPLLRVLCWLRYGQYALNTIIIAISASLLASLMVADARVGASLTVSIAVASLTLIVTAVQHFLGTRLAGHRRKGCLIFFIFFDLLCLLLQMPLIAVLSTAGLPSNCHGVATGADPAIFGPSGDDLVQSHCAVPNTTFWFSIFLLISYLSTIGLIIRQITTVSREMKQLRLEDKEHASNERIAAIVATHQTPRTWNRSRLNQVETIDLRDVRDIHSRDSERTAVPPSVGSTAGDDGDDPPPYTPDQVRDMATSLRKN
ncbi:hypothetical protein NOR_07577 [Metarhizium rileyi]|uniref:Uncharacterized protein n=1 Tax=Metarhizium rileyi (strain RCEF 4871) TaxID=1649241 RepID=A0A166Y3V3_METRR|nr:hypothetical protein NOR_07577 [Metarhizium rileyi RCEF 4871]TWU71411.1 hypothetical protein ED733_000841 [Metarhizium rileyi]